MVPSRKGPPSSSDFTPAVWVLDCRRGQEEGHLCKSLFQQVWIHVSSVKYKGIKKFTKVSNSSELTYES